MIESKIEEAQAKIDSCRCQPPGPHQHWVCLESLPWIDTLPEQLATPPACATRCGVAAQMTTPQQQVSVSSAWLAAFKVGEFHEHDAVHSESLAKEFY